MSKDSSSSSEEEDITREDDVKYCIKCNGSKLSVVSVGEAKFLACENQGCTVKMTLKDPSSDAKDRLSRIIEKVKKKRFKYCFRCGKEVAILSEKVMCSSELCDLNFSLDQGTVADTKSREHKPKDLLKRKPTSSFESHEDLNSSLDVSLSEPDSRKQKQLLASQASPTYQGAESKPHNQDSTSSRDNSTAGEEGINEIPVIDKTAVDKSELSSEHRPIDQSGDKQYDQQVDVAEDAIEEIPGIGTVQETSDSVVIQLKDTGEDSFSSEHTKFDIASNHDESLILPSPELIIEKLIPILKDVDWSEYVKRITIEPYKLREIREIQSNEACWRKILHHQLSVEDAPLSLLSEIAVIISDMDHKCLAEDVTLLTEETRKQLIKPTQCTYDHGVTKWSEICRESDNIATLMLPRPAKHLTGEELRKYVYSNRLSSRRTVTFAYLIKDCVKIVFNAFVPVEPWGWDKNSSVFVRFGNKVLGEWKHDCGKFSTQRSCEVSYQGKSTAKFVQIRGVFFIPEEFIQSASSEIFIYKYVIYTEKVFREQRQQTYWESITVKQTKNYVNRCFSIEKVQSRKRKTHELYDHIIWPPVESMLPNFIGRFFKKEQTPDEKFKIAFDLYFKGCKDHLFGDDESSKAFYAQEMACLYSKLSTSWYCTDITNHWPEAATNAATVVMDWVSRMAESLLDSSPKFKTWRFCCGITLLLFLKEIKISIEVKSAILCYKRLLRLLQPSIGEHSAAEQATCKQCSEEIDMLSEDTSYDWSALKDIVKCICSFLMKNDDSSSYEWLYGIIILHFLNGDIKPFVPYSDKLRVRDLRMHGQAGLDEKLFRKYNMQLQLDIKHY